MLIVTRKPDEVLFIGDDITVTVLSINGKQVRIGVVAPREVPVDRKELRERKLAAQSTVDPDETYHDYEGAS